MQRSCAVCGGKGKVDVPLSGGTSVLRRACLPCGGTGKQAGAAEPRRPRNSTATAGIACGVGVGLLLLCMLLLKLLSPTLERPAPDASASASEGPLSAKQRAQLQQAFAALLENGDAIGLDVADQATQQLEELVTRIVVARLGLEELQGADAEDRRARVREVTKIVGQRIAELEALIQARLDALQAGNDDPQFRALLRRLRGTREALNP